MIKIQIHKAKYFRSQWYYYVIPKRLTFKWDTPVYKWCFWVIGFPSKRPNQREPQRRFKP